MEFLKQFELGLITMAPIHISDGRKILKREYFLEDGYYYFPNMGLLYRKVLEQGSGARDKFENLIINHPHMNLKSILNQIGIYKYDFGGYRIKQTGFESFSEDKKRSGQLSDIHAFVKNVYGQPYIPGSSLKGAIRTILENQSLNHLSEEELKQIFAKIRVADSQALDIKNLTIVQKHDYNPEKRKFNHINLYREALKPLTRVTFRITCEGEEVASLIRQLTIDADRHYQAYYHKYLHNLKEEYQLRKFTKGVIYLGAGSGFWTKTRIHEADPSRFMRMRGKMKMSSEGGVFKLTKYKAESLKTSKNTYPLLKNSENYYEMGRAEFYIKELGD